MRAGHIEVFVRDVTVARAFYASVLGFEVFDVQGDGAFVWLRLGEREILLRPGAPPPPAARYRDAAVGFVLFTDDLTKTCRELEGRGLVFCGDDGPDCPTFTDPDGHWFQLVDPRQHGGG